MDHHHHQQSGRLFFDPSACHGNSLFLGSDTCVFQRSLLSMEDTSKKRPFFSTSADLYDEEYYDEQLPEKKRRLTPEQVNLLEKSFEAENKLEPERKTELAKKLGLQPRQVAVWFQNRRARCKTKQLERDYDLLKASYDSLRNNYDAAVKEKDSLKSQLKHNTWFQMWHPLLQTPQPTLYRLTYPRRKDDRDTVVSLTEKLEAKELTTEPTEDQCRLVGEATNLLSQEVNVKAEDWVSTGSAGSAVVDEDSRQLVDSGDSYFPGDDYDYDYHGGIVPGEEEDRSEDGDGYFTNVFVDNQQEEDQGEEALGWWVWS
ncbi:Homeobox-leucine zipper protein HAT5 [Linum perenne]